MSKISAILAVRMGSKRLYGKPLCRIEGKPIVGHLIEILRKVPEIDSIVLATSDKDENKIFIEYAKENRLFCYVDVGHDEEDVLEKCLESLRLQTIRPLLVVVDDGSKDKTFEIASKYADVVVGLPNHEDNWTGKPKLARVFNSGLKILLKEKVNAILISGADAIYPPDYLEEIIQRMVSQDIVLASGVAEGEESSSTFISSMLTFL